MDITADLLKRRLLLVTGKGGVGKTSVSAALALAAARAGKRPLVVTCDGRATLGRILGGGTEKGVATQVLPGVWGLCVDYRQALVDLISDMLGARRLVDAFLGNKVVNTFVNAAPSVMEMTLLHRVDIARTADEPGGPFSPIIVDLPASGHALALLSTPRAIMRLVRVGPLYKRSLELLRMVADRDHTALVVVTLPEELPVNETLELMTAASKVGVPTGFVVVNAVPHSPLHPGEAETLAHLSDEAPDPLRQWAQEALHGQERSSRAQAEISRLQQASPGGVRTVPFVTEHGPELTSRISRELSIVPEAPPSKGPDPV